MPHIKNALIRFRIIDRMIRNPYKPFPSRKELREACEESLYGSTYGDHICDSTIEKDIFAMRMDHDAPIKYSKRNDGYFYEDPHFSINEIPLSEDELSSIRFAVKTLQHFQEVPYFKEFGNAIDKIANRVSVAGEHEAEASAFIGFETVLSVHGNEYLTGLLQAIKEKTWVGFNYASFVSGELKQRRVLPLYLKEYRNRWYLISFDETKKDIITYALDRILDIDFTKEVSQELVSFDAEAYFAHSVGITARRTPPELVRIKADEVASKYIETQPFHSSQIRLPNSTTFELHVQVTEELIRAILSFVGEVEVLEPEHLKLTLIERIQKQLEKYHGNLS